MAELRFEASMVSLNQYKKFKSSSFLLIFPCVALISYVSQSSPDLLLVEEEEEAEVKELRDDNVPLPVNTLEFS